MIFGLIKTKKDKELEALKLAVNVFRGVVSVTSRSKNGNRIITKRADAIRTRDIDCRSKEHKKAAKAENVATVKVKGEA